MTISKRTLLKSVGALSIGAAISSLDPVEAATKSLEQAPVVGIKRVSAAQADKHTAKVYFTRKIDAEHLIKLYHLVNHDITGRVGIKLHTGERHGPDILPRDMVKAFQAQVPNSTIVETNTLYEGDRYTTKDHLETLKVNGWTFCPVDIMDADGGVDFPVNGKHLKKVTMGARLPNYNSLIVLTHFKGHAMGGFGGCQVRSASVRCMALPVRRLRTGTPGPRRTTLWNCSRIPAKRSVITSAATLRSLT